MSDGAIFMSEPETDFERWIHAELERRYAELMNAEIERWLIGDGTGEPLGIMDATNIEIYARIPDVDWTCHRGEWKPW